MTEESVVAAIGEFPDTLASPQGEAALVWALVPGWRSPAGSFESVCAGRELRGGHLPAEGARGAILATRKGLALEKPLNRHQFLRRRLKKL